MKNYVFKKTAGQTAKANDAQKVDNRNIIDYNYILEQLNNLDTDIYNNLNLSRAGICEKFRAAMQEYKNIECYTIGGYIFIKLSFYPYSVSIEAFTDHYCIYDNDSGRQLYKLHTADNCRIFINHVAADHALFAETYNPSGLQAAGRYYEVNLSFTDGNAPIYAL